MKQNDRSCGLGARMLRFRAMTGKSQRACAAESRMTLQTWYSIENGYQMPTKVTAEKINLLISGLVPEE